MFNLSSADAERSHEQELNGRVENSFSSVKILGRLCGLHCFIAQANVFGLSKGWFTIRRKGQASCRKASLDVVERFVNNAH